MNSSPYLLADFFLGVPDVGYLWTGIDSLNARDYMPQADLGTIYPQDNFGRVGNEIGKALYAEGSINESEIGDPSGDSQHMAAFPLGYLYDQGMLLNDPGYDWVLAWEDSPLGGTAAYNFNSDRDYNDLIIGLNITEIVDVTPATDFDSDGDIDIFDINNFAAAFRAGDPSTDFDGDGDVDIFDVNAFAAAYDANAGKSPSPGITFVPEPVTLFTIAAGFLGVFLGRKKKA